jgi:DNA repair protein RecO (recombination protein O)
LLDVVGFRPELFRCVSCGREIRPEAQYFSLEKGGILCPQCGGQERGSIPISLPGLKVLRHFQRSTYQAAAGVRIRAAVHAELDQLMESFLASLLERRLKVPHFIRRVRAIQTESDSSA